MRLSEARALLSSAGVENALSDARRIFSELGGIPMSALVGTDVECSSPTVEAAIMRRANREPLQYILGYTHFYKELYEVSEACLIPREDTEILVDTAIRMLPPGESVLDLCTGSGCVGVSVLSNTENTTATLVDVSAPALALAGKNAERNGVVQRTDLLLMDLTQEFPSGEWFCILSNPPYVSREAYARLERELYLEPKNAFLGGEDGGDFYRILVPEAKKHLKKGGFIAFEIGYDQAELLKALAYENSLNVEIIKDLSGNDRVALLTE